MAIFFTAVSGITILAGAAHENGKLLIGKAVMGDWTSGAPGIRRKITVDYLPRPRSNILAITLAPEKPSFLDAIGEQKRRRKDTQSSARLHMGANCTVRTE